VEVPHAVNQSSEISEKRIYNFRRYVGHSDQIRRFSFFHASLESVKHKFSTARSIRRNHPSDKIHTLLIDGRALDWNPSQINLLVSLNRDLWCRLTLDFGFDGFSFRFGDCIDDFNCLGRFSVDLVCLFLCNLRVPKLRIKITSSPVSHLRQP
jgi:hypothetical protein